MDNYPVGGGIMSCKKCEESPIETYVRVDNANVMVVGCEEHLRRLIELIRRGLDGERS